MIIYVEGWGEGERILLDENFRQALPPQVLKWQVAPLLIQYFMDDSPPPPQFFHLCFYFRICIMYTVDMTSHYAKNTPGKCLV